MKATEVNTRVKLSWRRFCGKLRSTENVANAKLQIKNYNKKLIIIFAQRDIIMIDDGGLLSCIQSVIEQYIAKEIISPPHLHKLH